MGVAEVGVPIRDPPPSLVLSSSQNISQRSTTAASESNPKPKKKICCACPDTKMLRDECIVEHGEAACTKWIEAHLKCLRAEGFKV
ncbi:cytochrome c oxidase copper chaperone 2-like [Magnolia sinica]|uniref:cytochrome c oxidase copper chaperone 2-like n=1 Tax=Magnolia sinica TaxID=86752 RepID=UPI00265AF3D5|nr:cytochrome c oxidase copper chaperone 2-like [Magnolia sinica]